MKQPTILPAKHKANAMQAGLLVLFFAVSFTTHSQPKLDSLKTVIQTARHDTTKAKALLNLSRQLYLSNPDTAIQIAQQALHIYKKKHIEKGIASAYNHLGLFHRIKSDYPTALDYFHRSLEIRKSLNDKKGIAASCNNIGLIYHNQSSYPQALGYYVKSIKIKRELYDTLNTHFANTYNNIGIIYDEQSSYPQALEYYFKSLEIHEEMGNKKYIAASY